MGCGHCAGVLANAISRMTFEFIWKDGNASRRKELAYQHWQGERIAQEQFFYDLAQFVPTRPGGANSATP